MSRETYTAMNKNLKIITLAAAALALLSSVGCNKLRARDQLLSLIHISEPTRRSYIAYAVARYMRALIRAGSRSTAFWKWSMACS